MPLTSVMKPTAKTLAAPVVLSLLLSASVPASGFISMASRLPAINTHITIIDNNTEPLSLLLSKKDLYDKLGLENLGLSRKVFEMALKGMDKLNRKDRIKNPILSIADFSKPSTEKRLFVIDLIQGELVFHTWVAHGRNSGTSRAQYFSNKPRSRKSSLGFYITRNPYMGSNGYSLKLEGVEPGVNHNAGARGIVIHGADYVSEHFIGMQGYLGRSQGCPAVTPELNEPLINTIKQGSCLFIYYPSPNYLSHSALLR